MAKKLTLIKTAKVERLDVAPLVSCPEAWVEEGRL